MRFKKYILLSLVLCGLVACSDDNTIEIPEAPVLEKAQLALAIKSEKGAMTKAAEEATPTDADVNTLTVGVFGTGWSMVYTKDATDSGDDTKEVGPQDVYAGAAEVIVVANAKDAVTSLGNASSLDEFMNTLISLEKENLEQGLTMSSGVMNVNIIADKTNYIGYAKSTTLPYELTVSGEKHGAGVEIYGKGPVPLVRNVASIALASANIGTELGVNYQSKSFSLKEVFIASAKGLSKAAAANTTADTWSRIEVNPFEVNLSGSVKGYDAYQVGQQFDANNTGAYKAGAQTTNSKLLLAVTDNDPKTVYNKEFYVYENIDGQVLLGETGLDEAYANHTLLIVKGDYTYLPKGLVDNESNYVKKEDCYYAIPVGEKVTIDSKEIEGFYVQRNYKYAITLTIIGPGSEIPYDPMISANVSASVKVEPWNVKTIHEEVE
jgi:hypothetical protein